MVIIDHIFYMTVEGQVVAVAQADGGYYWVTGKKTGKEDNLMMAIKIAARHAAREAKREEILRMHKTMTERLSDLIGNEIDVTLTENELGERVFVKGFLQQVGSDYLEIDGFIVPFSSIMYIPVTC